jgi:hypothetical protein
MGRLSLVDWVLEAKLITLGLSRLHYLSRTTAGSTGDPRGRSMANHSATHVPNLAPPARLRAHAAACADVSMGPLGLQLSRAPACVVTPDTVHVRHVVA